MTFVGVLNGNTQDITRSRAAISNDSEVLDRAYERVYLLISQVELPG